MSKTEPAPRETASRRDWLGVLAHAGAAELQRLAAPLLADYRFETLREPETALVMVRARIANTGDRYNLGEATLTRCVVRHVDAEGNAVAGVGHVLGTGAAHALQIAQLDALLQRPAHQGGLMQRVIEPLRRARRDRDNGERAATEASRVRFMTLQAVAA
jgi:alpha-D-ribose 1-methylphosphonate 5-triphosphate synthase subunit PhnG